MIDLNHKSTLFKGIALLLFVMGGFFLFQLWTLLFLFIQGLSLDSTIQNDLTDRLEYRHLLLLQVISHVFVLILPSWLWCKVFGIKDISIYNIPIKWNTLSICLLILLASFPLVGLSAKLNQLIPLPDVFRIAEDKVAEMMEKILNTNGLIDQMILFITIAVIPAIGEEWMFRGIIQNIFKKINNQVWFFVGISAFIFSAFHFQFEGFIPRFILGVVLGLIYHYTKNLVYPMILHFVFNGSQILILFVTGKDWMEEQNTISPIGWLDWTTGVFSVFIIIGLFG
ncbi:MAG: CPBP family intramembrane metalloprotease [Saprospiraceae bacterium]|nr:CPBP family intramembrane metalloprotease [Saprospiraceae bacterium]